MASDPGISTRSVLARLALVLFASLTLHVSMTKPNPPPKEGDRKPVCGLERSLGHLLRPFMTVFLLMPGVMEVTMSLVRLVFPAALSGTCAERLSFNSVALVGCVLGFTGMAIRLRCYSVLGDLFTFELALLPNHRLITTGPYAYVRHPAYTGGLVAMLGATVVNTSQGSWVHECGFSYWWGMGWGVAIGMSTTILVDRCMREDKLLRDTFEKEWDAWRERVIWRMIPWFY